MRVILIRHGHSLHNEDEDIYKYQNDNLLTLTPKGVKDAERYAAGVVKLLHNRLKVTELTKRGSLSVQVVASNQMRAKQTAFILHRTLSCENSDVWKLSNINQLSKPGSAEIKTEMAKSIDETPLLCEFFRDNATSFAPAYLEAPGPGTFFDYEKYKSDIDYSGDSIRSGTTVLSFRTMTERLGYFIEKFVKSSVYRGKHSAMVAVGHHYSISAAIVAALFERENHCVHGRRESSPLARNEAILKTVHSMYIHKGFLYDLGDLNFGEDVCWHSGTPLSPDNKEFVAPSALWYSLIDAGIENVLHVNSCQKASAALFARTLKAKPKAYSPKNRPGRSDVSKEQSE